MINNVSPILIATSLIISVFSSWTGLDMTCRSMKSTGVAANLWLITGGFFMGTGVWSMHFIGMQAMAESATIHYNPILTGVSLLIAIFSSSFSLWVVSISKTIIKHLLSGAIIMGGGISLMHYTGIAAIKNSSSIIFDFSWIILSIIISVLASLTALSIMFLYPDNKSRVIFRRVCAALLMGGGISGMHYVGMKSVSFPLNMYISVKNSNGLLLDALIILVTVLMLCVALLVSFIDNRQQIRTSLIYSSLESANEELARLALYDTLTKLPNRNQMKIYLENEFIKKDNTESFFSLMLMDIDGLKRINDTYGYEVGDRLLISISERIFKKLNGMGFLGRIVGGEFIFLTKIKTTQDAAIIAKQIVDATKIPFMIKNHEIRTTLSVGIVFYPFDGINESELLFNANSAMQHAKMNGRNNYILFHSSMNVFLNQQLKLMDDLWPAIESKQFILHYQPKFKISDRTITGFEALLRWKHPNRGLLMPDMFLPLAEKSGLLTTLGNWVINEACRQLGEWRKHGKLNWTVAVNISASQLAQHTFFEELIAILKNNMIPPEMLILEITESAALQNLEQSICVLNKLSEIGITSSIDDFGTGYSSLLYLKKLPVRELKIDRAFVEGLRYEGSDYAIISAILSLARILNLRVVAEGVETEEQLRILDILGCDIVQGYLLGKPVSSEFIITNEP